jgi:quercetin dioxygenase-like cupin family protein
MSSDSRSDDFEPTIFEFDEIAWVDERKEPHQAPKLIEEAERTGARRKRIATGQGGFFQQYTTMPPGFEVPMHAHDHDELFIVLSGGCTFWPDGPGQGVELKARDTVALAANHEYSFVCGPEGMEFYVIRRGEAGVTPMA